MRDLRGLLTIAQAAKLLGVSRQRMHKFIEQYHVPVGRVGRTMVVEQRDLATLVPRKRPAPGKPKKSEDSC